MKKKWIYISLCILLLTYMTGCGTSDNIQDNTAQAKSALSESVSSNEDGLLLTCEDDYLLTHFKDYCGTESAEGKKVGMTLQSLNNDFMLELAAGLEKSFQSEGISLQIEACENDAGIQAEQIENFIAEGMDMIIVFPFNGSALVSAIEKAEQAGIPTLAFAMDVPSEAITTRVLSVEDQVIGKYCGDMVNEWIHTVFPDAKEGDVKVLVIGAVNSEELSERSDGIEASLKENAMVSVVRRDTTDYNNSGEGMITAENMFATDSFDVVVAANAATTLGVEIFIESESSPIRDRSRFGIFTVDETEAIYNSILASKENASCIRGTVSMGSIEKSASVVLCASLPILTDGTPLLQVRGSAYPMTADSF